MGTTSPRFAGPLVAPFPVSPREKGPLDVFTGAEEDFLNRNETTDATIETEEDSLRKGWPFKSIKSLFDPGSGEPVKPVSFYIEATPKSPMNVTKGPFQRIVESGLNQGRLSSPYMLSRWNSESFNVNGKRGYIWFCEHQSSRNVIYTEQLLLTSQGSTIYRKTCTWSGNSDLAVDVGGPMSVIYFLWFVLRSICQVCAEQMGTIYPFDVKILLDVPISQERRAYILDNEYGLDVYESSHHSVDIKQPCFYGSTPVNTLRYHSKSGNFISVFAAVASSVLNSYMNELTLSPSHLPDTGPDFLSVSREKLERWLTSLLTTQG